MKKKLGLVSGLLALCVTTSAFALELNVKYNVDDYELNLTGKAYAPVSVIVAASDASELSADSAATVSAEYYEWRGETAINETIALDPNLPSNTYILRARTNEQYMSVSSSAERLYGSVVDNKQLIEKSFYHINTIDAALLLAEINKVSANPSALCNLISQGSVGTYSTPCIELLDLNSADFAAYGSYACRQMVGTKNGGAYSGLEEFKKLLEEYRLLFKASKMTSASSAITVLKDNSSVFGASNISTYVVSLSPAAQQKFYELIKTFSANGRAFSQQIPELSALATVQSADRWQTIKTVVIDSHKSVLNIDCNVNNLDNVFQKMMSYTYTAFGDIAAGFAKADSEVNNVPYEPPVNKGSGGGSFQMAPTAAEQRGETNDGSHFSDVPADFWAADAISRLSKLGVINGYPNGTFSPDGYVTRAEFVKMLCSAFSIIDVGASVDFTDVATDDWHYDYIRRAYGARLINGVSDFAFNPNGTISREDASTIVHRYLSGKGALSAATMQFADAHEFSDYAKAAIASLAGNRIVNGVGEGVFDAKGNITRAACAVLICNCLDV